MIRWLLLLLVLGSCGTDLKKETSTAKKFYDINGLIERQVKLLDSIGPVLLKTAIINGKEEVLESPSRNDVWSRELELFRSADINKPLLLESYFTSEKIHSGISQILYISKDPRATTVDSLIITLQEHNNDPIKVQVKANSQNTLFESEKMMTLLFTNHGGRQVVSAYRIEGWQKMISKDSTFYTIDAAMKYP